MKEKTAGMGTGTLGMETVGIVILLQELMMDDNINGVYLILHRKMAVLTTTARNKN